MRWPHEGPLSEPGRDEWSKGNHYFLTGKYPDAVWAYSEAILRNPSQPAYYRNRAIARAALNDAEGAREDLWRAIELDSRSPGLATLRGTLGARARRRGSNATLSESATLPRGGPRSHPPGAPLESGSPLPADLLPTESGSPGFDRLKATGVPSIEVLRAALATD